MNTIIAEDLLGKCYVADIIKIRYSQSVNFKDYVDFNKFKIKEIYWRYLRNKYVIKNIKVDIKYKDKQDTINYDYINFIENLKKEYKTNNSYKNKKYPNIFSTKIEDNVSNISIDFATCNDVEILIVYEKKSKNVKKPNISIDMLDYNYM